MSVPSALDMVNFGARDNVPFAYEGRRLQVHNPQVTLMGTTPTENDVMGRWIGERLNRMDGPVRFFLPEGGVSTTNRQLIRIKSHINDPEFASAVVTAFRALNGRAGVRKRAAR
jgi:uncharacterized protein (UPF0261 family)